MRFVIVLLFAAWFVPIHQILAQQREAGTATSTTLSSSSNRYWGVTADIGPAAFDVGQLNAFFVPYTAASLPREGIAQTLQFLVSNKVFGYGSAYYQQALTLPAWDQSTPTLSLHQHTVGFELHKVLVDKRIKVVLPSAGIGYRFTNVTYSPDQTAVLPLDSLFRQPSSFTLRNPYSRVIALHPAKLLYRAVFCQPSAKPLRRSRKWGFWLNDDWDEALDRGRAAGRFVV